MGSPFTLSFPNPKRYVPEATGHYSVSLVTGLTTGLAAGATLLSFRWSDATNNPALQCMIKGLRVAAETTTAFTTAQDISVGLFIARAFTASDTGGTASIPTANNQKRRTNMATTAVADLRVATAAAVAAGTRTVDTFPVYQPVAFSSAIGPAVFSNPAFVGQGNDAQLYPIVLAQNEGVLVNLTTAQGAVGVVKYFFDLEWAEGMF
jgi:hypothetical protein